MAFPDPLSIKNAAAAAVTFSRYGVVPNGNLYRDTASSAALVTLTAIRRIFNPKKGTTPATNRHIVTFSRERVDADDNRITGSLSLSLVRPLAADITDADIADLFAMCADFLIASSGDYKTRFQRGET